MQTTCGKFSLINEAQKRLDAHDSDIFYPISRGYVKDRTKRAKISRRRIESDGRLEFLRGKSTFPERRETETRAEKNYQSRRRGGFARLKRREF